jgi:hypothetical protein
MFFSQETTMLKSRTAEFAAMMMIGDATLALLEPRRHARLWQEGPRWWRAVTRLFVQRPALTRAAGAAGLVLGLWLAHGQRAAGAEDRGS